MALLERQRERERESGKLTNKVSALVPNQADNTRWGASNIPLTRWLPAEYLDDVSVPKGWRDEENNGHVLPNSRDVSNHILAFPMSELENDLEFSYMETIFGQFLDHDLTFTPHSPVIRSFSDGIDCEHSCARTEPCYPIPIPNMDPRFGENSEKCIPFSRSAPTCGSGKTGAGFGALNTRQQLNTLTSFIDGSNVYGSDDSKAKFLRDLTTDEGKLKVNTKFSDNGFDFLPFKPSSVNMCATRARITNTSDAEEVPCFVAGDDRSNENILLTAVHTLFMREHNRIVSILKQKNPMWDGEKLYQEGRKIVGAILQIFTYRDFLRHILGPDVMAEKLSTYPGYDETIDPSISNSFATASFRFAHGMLQPFAFRLDENYQNHPEFPTQLLHKTFVSPWRVIYEGGVDPILRGLIGKPSKLNTQDSILTDEVRDRLFKLTSDVALDLGALNIQRGRDHALPGYNKWRQFCGLSQPQNEKQLAKVLKNKDLAKRLMTMYGTADNIDLWLGGMTEPFVRGGRVGPLFACLISTQFQNLRQGDRHWWENKGVFTEAQKRALRDVSLSRVICDNTGIKEVPRDAFLFRPRGNGYTRCEDIPEFDLSPWEERGTLVLKNNHRTNKSVFD
uniref:Eosinophil peroxidase-like n=1 Tax=Gouania willdenowi TaxID=441366 RepID=A0A8C5EGH1_GOUWI